MPSGKEVELIDAIVSHVCMNHKGLNNQIVCCLWYEQNSHIISVGEAGGWRFASTEYFGPASDVEGLLEQTVKPLSNIVFKQNGANTSGIKLARVKALLGKPVNDVEEVFQYTLDECEKENRTKNYEMWGMYYESIRDTEKAIEQYEHAIGYHQSRGTGGGWEPRFAKRRVGILQKQ